MDAVHPRVSLGIAVYNGERYLRQTIESLLGQTCTDFELIISDNGSTDATEAICREYATKDSRIRYYRNDENRGPSWNYRRIFELARGEYFKWADYDDFCAPTYLERCVAGLDATPEAVLCHSKTVMVDEHGNVPFHFDPGLRISNHDPAVRFFDLIRALHYSSQIHGVMRSSVLRDTPLIGSYLSSDLVLLCWLSLRGPFLEIPEDLFFNRRHGEQSPRDRFKSYEWFNPRLKGRITLPHWVLFTELVRAVHQASIPLGVRLRCYIYVAQWSLRNRNRRLLVEDMAKACVQFIARFNARKHWELASRID